MLDELRVELIQAAHMELLLPMIAAYQRFYGVAEADIEEERNRVFFSRFVAPSEDGALLGAWRDDGPPPRVDDPARQRPRPPPLRLDRRQAQRVGRVRAPYLA